MILLRVADLNSQAIEAVLDNVLYYIILDWNESGQYWGLGIRNSAYINILDGISVSANYPLTRQFRYSDMPAGELMVCSSDYRSGPVPRDGFATGRYELIYVTQDDLLTEGLLDFIGRTQLDAV
jgi:hypothetical protein